MSQEKYFCESVEDLKRLYNQKVKQIFVGGDCLFIS